MLVHFSFRYISEKSEYVTGKDAPFPMMHLDFVLDLILETDRITYIEKSILEDFDMPQSLNVEMVGPLICGLMQSPGEKQNSSVFDTLLAKKSNRNKGLSFIYYPGDTKVCITSGKATKVDLIPDGTISDIFRLVPERYKLWKGQTTGSANIQYLKWLTPESKCKFPNLIGFMMEWPNYATEWVSRDRPNPFLSPEMIQSIVRLGCHVVPAKPDSGFEDIMTDYIPDNLVEFQTWWNISFATAEKYVCRALTKRQRQCFIVYKYLASLGIQESDRLPAVIVSHVFFYAIENIPTENWTYFPYQCILVVLKRLRDDLQEKRLPHYFMTQKNLLQYVPDDIRSNVLDSLNHIISNPVGALYQAFECLGVMSSATNINIFVDEAFRDMYNFALHGDCKRSFWKALVPTCSQVMKDILDSDEYEIAFGLLQSLNSRQAEILKESQSTCEIATLLTESLFMFDRWAFYYFMDISTGTALTFKLCNDIPSIQIAEVFGPELQEILTEALLPVEAAIDSGNVLYALRMVSVLKSINHPEATVSSLKFYLKRYIEYAGEALVLPLSDQEANIAILQGRTAFRKLKGTQTFSKDMLTSSSLMYCLHDLHVTLFNTCQALKRDEEYVEFIPHFKAVVETLGAPPCRRNLVAILKNFGGETDASQQQPVTAILRLCGFSAIENDEASF